MEQIVKELAKLNDKADKMISIMEKPENRLEKFMEFFSNVVGIIGILAIIEIIRNWIMGG